MRVCIVCDGTGHDPDDHEPGDCSRCLGSGEEPVEGTYLGDCHDIEPDEWR